MSEITKAESEQRVHATIATGAPMTHQGDLDPVDEHIVTLDDESDGVLGPETPLERACANPQSLSLAIKATCWDCVGAGADPNPRNEIRTCKSQQCPLVPVRPWAGRVTAGRRSAITAKCKYCQGHYPNVVDRIRECDIQTCGLWHVRTHKAKPST
jgi:hypothetical protein